MQRRAFLRGCAQAATAIGALPSTLAEASNAPLKRYERVRLVNADQRPVAASELEVGRSYIFNYPFVTTPCFLIDLGRPVSHNEALHTEDGDSYLWPGGVGPNRSLVSFSAICAHKMSHPAKTVSFINYRHQTVSFRDRDKQLTQADGVILCCSEKSVYDPARGAAVLGGPAKQPLCTILIEHDADSDALFALGSYGGEMFEQFFEKFSVRLQLEWGIADVAAPVRETTPLTTIERYSRTQMLCGA